MEVFMFLSQAQRYLALLLLSSTVVLLPMQQPDGATIPQQVPVISDTTQVDRSAQQKQRPKVSIQDPKGPFNEPIDPAKRRVSSMISGAGGAVVWGCLAWIFANKIIAPTNAWWTTEDRNSLITKSGAILGGIFHATVANYRYSNIRKDIDQKTFLDAIEHDDAALMKRWLEDDGLLLKTGLRIKSMVTWQDSQGRTPLMLAVIRGSYEVAELLVQKGNEQGHDINTVDNEGRTALHWAAEKRRFAMAELLLQHGASKSIIDKNGYIPFLLAPASDARLKELLLIANQPLGQNPLATRPPTKGEIIAMCGAALFVLLSLGR